MRGILNHLLLGFSVNIFPINEVYRNRLIVQSLIAIVQIQLGLGDVYLRLLLTRQS